jgi:hypothetical protein
MGTDSQEQAGIRRGIMSFVQNPTDLIQLLSENKDIT